MDTTPLDEWTKEERERRARERRASPKAGAAASEGKGRKAKPGTSGSIAVGTAIEAPSKPSDVSEMLEGENGKEPKAPRPGDLWDPTDAGHNWWIPGSVLTALWAKVMPQLAATLWKTDLGIPANGGGARLRWPPESDEADQIEFGSFKGFHMQGKALSKFWDGLARLAFGNTEAYEGMIDRLNGHHPRNEPQFSRGQRQAHLVLEYFNSKDDGNRPPREPDRAMQLRVFITSGYDFVLHSDGLDIFVPPGPHKDAAGNVIPGEEGRNQLQVEILRMYRFRATGSLPIGLPNAPSSSRN